VSHLRDDLRFNLKTGTQRKKTKGIVCKKFCFLCKPPGLLMCRNHKGHEERCNTKGHKVEQKRSFCSLCQNIVFFVRRTPLVWLKIAEATEKHKERATQEDTEEVQEAIRRSRRQWALTTSHLSIGRSRMQDAESNRLEQWAWYKLVS
jgi:hypothetical protein